MEKSRNEKVILNKIGPSHHLVNPNGKIFLAKVIEEAYGNLKQYTEKKILGGILLAIKIIAGIKLCILRRTEQVKSCNRMMHLTQEKFDLL